MKIFFKKYDAHNTQTSKWNDFFEMNEDLQRFLTTDVHEADLIICAGGDGTLLKTVKEYIDYDIPIYGINAGTLGFLMNNISQHDFLVNVCERNQFDIKHLTTIRNKVIESNGKESTHYAFNETAIGGDMGSWIEFDIDSKVLPRNFKGGGMIVSTPQGSTGISKNNHGVIVPIQSKQWVVTGDKTDIKLNTVIKPRKTSIEVKSRNRTDIWIDGNNGFIKDIKSVVISKGPKVQICFSNFDEFVEKRYK